MPPKSDLVDSQVGANVQPQLAAAGGAILGGVIGFFADGPRGVLPGAKIGSDTEDKIIEATTGKTPGFFYQNMGTDKKTGETKK